MLEEVQRIGTVTLYFQQTLQPLVGLLLQGRQLGVTGFIQPMGGHTSGSNIMHLVTAYLHFYRRAKRAK